jgi:hypothetical protein
MEPYSLDGLSRVTFGFRARLPRRRLALIDAGICQFLATLNARDLAIAAQCAIGLIGLTARVAALNAESRRCFCGSGQARHEAQADNRGEGHEPEFEPALWAWVHTD